LNSHNLARKNKIKNAKGRKGKFLKKKIKKKEFKEFKNWAGAWYGQLVGSLFEQTRVLGNRALVNHTNRTWLAEEKWICRSACGYLPV
jgi:hypothetical protein